MAHTQGTQEGKGARWLQHLRHWLAHPTSELLPPIFGDAVSPDLKILQAEVEEARHDIREVPAPPAVHGGPSKPARGK